MGRSWRLGIYLVNNEGGAGGCRNERRLANNSKGGQIWLTEQEISWVLLEIVKSGEKASRVEVTADCSVYKAKNKVVKGRGLSSVM